MPLIASDDLLILTTRALCLQANYDVKTVAGKAFVMDALSLIARESCSIFMPTGQFLKDKNPPAKLFRSFLKTEIENQKRASCDFER